MVPGKANVQGRAPGESGRWFRTGLIQTGAKSTPGFDLGRNGPPQEIEELRAEWQQSTILTVRPPPGPKYYYQGLPGPPRLLHECIRASRRRCATDPAGAVACRRGPKSPYSNIILSQDEIMPSHSGLIFACFLGAVGTVGPAGCP